MKSGRGNMRKGAEKKEGGKKNKTNEKGCRNIKEKGGRRKTS